MTLQVIEGGGEAEAWRGRLKFKILKGHAEGPLLSTVPNVAEVLMYDPAWVGVLGYDEFADAIVIRRQPPWPKSVAGSRDLPRPWTDQDTLRLCRWLDNSNYGTQGIKPLVCNDGVTLAATSRPFHPVREYLHGIPWDGILRLDSWLSTYLGAEASDYSRVTGRMWLISAVARVMRPGEEAHHVLILEGGQGAGKSSALRTLFGRAWYTDTSINIGSKDAMQSLGGRWCVELAELDSLIRADRDQAKAFFTSSVDVFRPPYGRHFVTVPRQCVFAGTVNPGARGYLDDETGARRYWPTACGRIDLEALARDRDQLWAEALAEWHDGRPFHPDPTMFAYISAEQSSRYQEDAWEPVVATWLESSEGRAKSRAGLTQDDVFRLALGIDDRSKMPAREQVRLGRVMHRLGFRRARLGPRGNRTRLYVLGCDDGLHGHGFGGDQVDTESRGHGTWTPIPE